MPNPIPLSTFLRRLPNEDAVAYTLPAGTVFMMTKLNWAFTADNPALNGDALFTVGNFYRMKATLYNGRAGVNDGTTFGVPITNMSQVVKVSMFGDPTQTPVAGTLYVRLWGILRRTIDRGRRILRKNPADHPHSIQKENRHAPPETRCRPALLVILALLGAGAAPAAILQKGSQIVNLVAPLINDGNITFSELYIRNSDGSVYPLRPAGQYGFDYQQDRSGISRPRKAPPAWCNLIWGNITGWGPRSPIIVAPAMTAPFPGSRSPT